MFSSFADQVAGSLSEWPIGTGLRKAFWCQTFQVGTSTQLNAHKCSRLWWIANDVPSGMPSEMQWDALQVTVCVSYAHRTHLRETKNPFEHSSLRQTLRHAPSFVGFGAVHTLTASAIWVKLITAIIYRHLHDNYHTITIVWPLCYFYFLPTNQSRVDLPADSVSLRRRLFVDFACWFCLLISPSWSVPAGSGTSDSFLGIQSFFVLIPNSFQLVQKKAEFGREFGVL